MIHTPFKTVGKSRVYFLSSIFGLIFYLYLFYSETGSLPNNQSQILYLLISVITANIIGGVISRLNRWLNTLISWKKNIGTRLLIDILVKYISAWFIIGCVGTAILIFQGIPVIESINTSTDLITKIMILLLLIMIANSVINFTFFSYNEYALGQIEKVKQERKQLALQYEALKNQLSPHYLFNSLNTISSLIYESKEQTEKFIRRLVDTYQYILDNENNMLVSLEKELNFVRSYQYLLSVRYRNGIQLKTSINEQLYNHLLPPLSLQILVENGVKHNVFDSQSPLEISIKDSGNAVIVSNNKTGTPAQVNSLHLGLENIQKRYNYFTRSKISIMDNKDCFTVTVPLIQSDEFQNGQL